MKERGLLSRLQAATIEISLQVLIEMSLENGVINKEPLNKKPSLHQLHKVIEGSSQFIYMCHYFDDLLKQYTFKY